MFEVDKLDKALRTALNSPEKLQDFYDVLLGSEVYVITQKDALPHGLHIATQDMALPMLTLRNRNNEKLFPFFSCHKKINAMLLQKGMYCKISFRDFLATIEYMPCVLNPLTDCSKEFTTNELKKIGGQT